MLADFAQNLGSTNLNLNTLTEDIEKGMQNIAKQQLAAKGAKQFTFF